MLRWQQMAVVAAAALVTLVPFLLRPSSESRSAGEDSLVLLSPHNESIRSEFSEGFRRWYYQHTGRSVALDWRSVGGTSEIVQFMEAQYAAAFQQYWTRTLGRDWTRQVAASWRDPRLDEAPATADAEAVAARREFLASEVGIGVDLLFGGGSFDHRVRAAQGLLVPSRVRQVHPEWFTAEVIPQSYAGEILYDAQDRWFGAVLASFGLIFNRDALHRVGIKEDLSQWSELADPRLVGKVALADPSKSGAITKAFEMIVQQVMQESVRGSANTDPSAAVAEGWSDAMRLLQRICANARYFTDAASKPVLDVARGDCAAGMAIDFYGRVQQQNLQDRSGSDRFVFVMPRGGSSLSADPIALLRGAPNREVAELFIEFVLSEEGQQLWDYRRGVPGGPEKYALRRAPIRRDAYRAEKAQFRSSPEEDPYAEVADFVYQPEYTGALFGVLRTLIKTAFIDCHPELQQAWKAIQAADQEGRSEDVAAALRLFDRVDDIDYAAAQGTIRQLLRQDARTQLEGLRELSERFRLRYREVTQIARGEAE